MTRGSYDAKKLDLFLGFKVKSQLCAWTTSAAVCAKGFCKKELQLSAQLRVVRKELQLSAQLRDCKKGPLQLCA